MNKLLLAAVMLAVTAVPTFAGCDHPGCPRPPQENNCGILGCIPPMSINANVADIKSDVDSYASSGWNMAVSKSEIEDLHWSKASLALPETTIHSGAATAYTSSLIAANFIEPGCHDCTPVRGILANLNMATIRSYVDNGAETGHNFAKTEAEIEDLCGSRARITAGGVTSVVTDPAYSNVESLINVNMIGDWTKKSTESP